MASHNEITGDALVSKKNNDNYRNNYDAIFGKKKKDAEQTEQQGEEASVQDQESALRSMRKSCA
jgi:hypothetical protein